jgi:hypothetical protein
MSARLLAIVLLTHVGAAAGADLGRLFFTPAQRATLDNARKQNIRVEIGTDNSDQPQAAAPAPQNMSVNGVVRRSDGKSTVWVNNHPVAGTDAGGIKVVPGKTGDRVKLTMPDSGRSVDLKVGQTAEILSGRIEEGYSRRSAPQAEFAPTAKPVAAGAATPQPPAAPAQTEAGPAK